MPTTQHTTMSRPPGVTRPKITEEGSWLLMTVTASTMMTNVPSSTSDREAAR